MKQSIMIDMDDVIVICRFRDFLKEFLGEIDFINSNNYYLQDFLKDREEEFKERYKYKNLYRQETGDFIEPLPNCVEVIKKLNNNYDVYFVTTYVWKNDIIDASTNLKNKFEYLNYWFPFIDTNNYIFMTDKTKVHYDIGIDDRIKNLKNCNKKLLFSTDSNRIITDEEFKKEGINRVFNWLDIEKELCNVC